MEITLLYMRYFGRPRRNIYSKGGVIANQGLCPGNSIKVGIKQWADASLGVPLLKIRHSSLPWATFKLCVLVLRC